MGQLRLAVAVEDRRTEHLAHLEGYRAEHGGLVRAPDALLVNVRIEARRCGVGELGQQSLTVAPVADVVARAPCLGAVEHNEIVASAVLPRLGCRGEGFL